METLITQLSNTLLSPAGTMLFYLVVAFSVAFSLQMLLTKKNILAIHIRNRSLLAFGLLFIGLIALFISSAFSWQNLINPRLLLPLLERSMIAFSLLWLAWIWCLPRPDKVWDISVIFFSIFIVFLFFFTYQGWQIEVQSLIFNKNFADWVWSITTLSILFVSCFLMILKRPHTWGTGLAAMITPAIAIVLHLFFLNEPGDYSVLLRISVLFSFSVLPQMTADLVTLQTQTSQLETDRSGIEKLNQHLKTLAESNPKIFQHSIPNLLLELAAANSCMIIKDSKQSPKILLDYHPGDRFTDESPHFSFELEPEEIPNLSHALESQFILTFDKAPGFRDEFRQLGKKVNIFGALSVLVLPYPIQPETKNSLVLVGRTRNQWSEVSQAELASAVNSLLLIYHQKQREEQLQKSVQRLLESKQPDFRSVSSFNYQNLQQNFNLLSQQHEGLQDRFKNLQHDLQFMAGSLEEMAIRTSTRDQFNQNIHILKSWLDQAQTQNSLLQAELEQVLREKQSLNLEIDHYRNAQQLSEHYAYLQPQDSQPLDDKTNLNETLARAQELLFKITEMNNILEQNQVQSVIVLESIQEQVTNLHQFQKDDDEVLDGESFLIHAEYFLEDIRTAQSVLKEQSRLQKMLEESFLNSLKMKDHFDHLTQINHRNYKKINQIYSELEKNLSKSEQTGLILSTIQEENEKLRLTMLEALAKNKGDSLTIDNLQSEMLSSLEEINILKDKIEQKQDLLYNLQMDKEMMNEGVKENNQIITSLIQDILQPISTITGCSNLLSASLPEDSAATKLFNQIYASIRTIQDQVNKLIACTERNSQLLMPNHSDAPIRSSSQRPLTPPEALTSYE